MLKVNRESVPADSIAVIAVQGRFPGARHVEEFWNNLIGGVESISTFSEAELRAAGIDSSYMNVLGYVNRGCVLEDIDLFDAGFFGYSARDAETMDPQQRLFLECAWESFELAGYDPLTYPGMIGVFAGCDQSTYIYQIYSSVDLSAYGYGGMMAIGNDKDYLATQVSYKLNLRGPSVTIQTSCSTSLVAICMACQNLRHGYCDMALAGGSAVNVPQKKGYWYQPGGIVSPDGRCRPFDANGQGTVVGNGVGIVVLKRLSDALEDGDHIRAVIKGFGLNNDGAAKVGYTAPSIEGQSQAIRMAQRMAGVEPDTIGYIEAHGTATALGDPVEIAALSKAFRERTNKKQFCAIGALKSNVGHLSSSAGVSGLIKAVLTVEHGQIPPCLNYREPNPHLDLANSPFFVASELTNWPSNGHPRRAGVSSFGVGGTNAHIVLEQAPPAERGSPGRDKQVLLLSARTPTALEKATENLIDHLEKSPATELADVAYTLQVGRSTSPHRRAVVFDRSDRQGLLTVLRSRDPERVRTVHSESIDRPVVFLFPGQGSQYVGMGAELYRTEPGFRAHLDECRDLLVDQIGLDLHSVLYPAESDRQRASEQLGQTSLTQPALFAIEYALARLWMEWGITPKAMAGHSIGEYVAACLSGVITLKDSLAVVAMRGRLMDSMPGGSMLAVPLPEASLQPVLQANISLAAVNAPSMCVLSGPAEAIAALERQFAAQGLPYRKLHTSHAFHSSMMDPVLAQFVERVRRIELQPPQIPYLSNLTGTWITPELSTSPEYWGYHLRQTVRFSDDLCEVMTFPDLALLEVGPGQTLGFLARQQGSRSTSQLIVSSLPGPQEKDHVSDSDVITGTIGQLWLGGVRIDWKAYCRGQKRRRVLLPTYPFERQRYWLGPLEEVAPAEAIQPQAAKATEISAAESQAPAAPVTSGSATRDARRGVDDWFFVPVWRPAVPTPNPSKPELSEESWLVLGQRDGLGAEVLESLRQTGVKANLIVPGAAFERQDRHCVIRITERMDYDALVQDLKQRGEYPQRVLHLWSTDCDPQAGSAIEALDAAQDRSFSSVMSLCQALAKVSPTSAVQIGVVTDRLHSVIGNEALRRDEATVLGACKVLSQEYPNLRCRNIDIELSERGNADALIHEMRAQPFQAVVAYRKNRRWLEAYEPVRLEAPAQMPLFQDGKVYLITGGLGNIALLLAEAIGTKARAKFVLTGRSSFPPRQDWDEQLRKRPSDASSAKIRRLLALERMGCEVMVTQADVTDTGQMKAAIDQALARWGAVHGLIHGAANLSPSAFAPAGAVSHASRDEHFRPKAHGLLIVEELLRDQPLEFCIMLSSLSAVLGGLGLACYAASNAYLDAAARQRNQWEGGATWITVNWDAWSFTPGPPPADAIGPADGQDCFRRIIGSALKHVVVSTTPLGERLSRWVDLQAEPEMHERAPQKTPSSNGNQTPTAVTPAAGPSHARPNLSTPFMAPRNDTEKSIAAVWEHLLGISPVGIHDKFFELGGHSLLAVQLLARLRDIFDVDLPVQRIFEAPTIAQLAGGIDLEKPETASSTASSSADPTLNEVMKLVQGLSDEEVEALIAEAEAAAKGSTLHG